MPVSEDLQEALRQGLQLASPTDGLFDPTVGPLVKLWGIGSDKAHVPAPEQIRSALRLVGWKDVVLDEQAKTIALRRPGMTLDFGALLKGFAAVETGRILSTRGVKSAIVDVGGSVLALGSRPDGAPWRIGIQKPDAPTGISLGLVEVRDEVVNTSGSYEQFFVSRGRRYQHILDPRSGYPVDDGVVSATVIAPRLRNADGPTLSIMALGVERGLTFAKQLGVDAIILDSHRVVHMTPGAARRFALLDSTYSISRRHYALIRFIVYPVRRRCFQGWPWKIRHVPLRTKRSIFLRLFRTKYYCAFMFPLWNERATACTVAAGNKGMRK